MEQRKISCPRSGHTYRGAITKVKTASEILVGILMLRFLGQMRILSEVLTRHNRKRLHEAGDAPDRDLSGVLYRMSRIKFSPDQAKTMMTYKERAWCSHKCGNWGCYRNYTDEDHRRNIDGPDLPLSMTDFKTDTCGYLDPALTDQDSK